MDPRIHDMVIENTTVRNDCLSGASPADAVRLDNRKRLSAGTPGDPNRKRLFVAALLLAAVILMVYWPVTGFDFVDFDDDGYVTDNARVKRGLNVENLRWAFTTFHLSNWHPLTWISHMTDSHLFGLNPGAHHRTNILIHVVNTVILLGLLFRMTGAPWKSAFVAGLFALHPLHVESVAWISERKDVLSTCFGFLAVYFYIPYARQKNGLSYVLSMACFVLSIMAKPMMVTLPFLLLLFDFWPLARVPQLLPRTEGNGRKLAGLVVEKIPFFCISAMSCMMAVVAQGGGAPWQQHMPTPQRHVCLTPCGRTSGM